MGGAIAEQWADERSYPLWDRENLPRVAQFVAVVEEDPMAPKEDIQKFFDGKAPDLSHEDEPHRVLAGLPLPIFLTTNYDDFMTQALRARGKQPEQEFCRWTARPTFDAKPSVFDRPEGFEPSEQHPLVFHLHGRIDIPESLVLTEDDYVDFLVNISRTEVVPPRIREALADSMLLFIGYSLGDWNFRVLYRALVEAIDPSGRRSNLTVQLSPGEVRSKEAAQEYLDRYFGAMMVHVYWGDAKQFLAELRDRWAAYRGE